MTTWKQIPDYFKVVKPVARLKNILPDPQNKELNSLLKVFVSNDATRLKLTGYFFDKKRNAIIATDANILAHYKTADIAEGHIYQPGTSKTINEKYPDYTAVVPKKSTWYKVDLLKLQSYTQVASLFCNQITQMVYFRMGEDLISFNYWYFQTCLNFWRKLGQQSVYFGFNGKNRAGIFLLDPKKPVLSQTFCLVMPMAYDFNTDIQPATHFYGAQDIDMGYQLEGIYEISKNEIVFGTASDAIEVPATLPKVFAGNLTIDLLKKVVKTFAKRPSRPILDFAIVEKDGTLKITNFVNYLVIKNSGLPSGFYRKAGTGILIDTSDDYEFDEYPSEKNFDTVETITASGSKTDYLQLRIRIAAAKLKLLKL